MSRGFNSRCFALAAICYLLATAPPVAAEDLSEAWNEALSVDQSLEASRWRSSAAQRGLAAARAERLPMLNSRASYNVYDNPITYVAPVSPVPGLASFDITQREALLADVTASQPLYTGGRIRSGINAAGAQVSAAVSNEQMTELDVLLDVAIVYTNVLQAQRVVEVTERQLQSLTKHAQDVKNRVDQGVGIRNNLLAAQVAQADARQQRLQADAILDVARAAYNRALRRPLDTPVSLDELNNPTQTFDLNSVTERALAGRPEIAELNANVRALRSQAGVVRAGYHPQIAVEGGFQYIENKFLDNEAFNRVSVVGEWNVLDLGRKRNKAVKLEQNAEALIRQRADVETRIALQVRDAWRRLETTKERILVNRTAIRSAEENLQVARNRYNQGAGTNTEVLDAETLRTGTYTNYYSSVYAATRALMQLGRAVGDFSLADVQPPGEEAPAAPDVIDPPEVMPLPPVGQP